MITDRERLQVLLMRLREFELRLPLPHERAILEVARQSVRDQVSLLSHRLFDLGYTQLGTDETPRVAC